VGKREDRGRMGRGKRGGRKERDERGKERAGKKRASSPIKISGYATNKRTLTLINACM